MLSENNTNLNPSSVNTLL